MSISDLQPANEESAMRVSIFLLHIERIQTRLFIFSTWNWSEIDYKESEWWPLTIDCGNDKLPSDNRLPESWGSVDQDLCHHHDHMASPWSKELTPWGLETPYDTWIIMIIDTRSNFIMFMDIACLATPRYALYKVHVQKELNVTDFVILTHWPMGFKCNFR